MQQHGKFTPKLIERIFLTTTGNEEISRFTIMKGRRKVDHNSRLSIPRHKLIIPKLHWLLQKIHIQEFVYTNHISLMDKQPNLHLINDNSPQVRHELSRSYVQTMKNLHNKRMDRKPKATQEVSFIEPNFIVSKCHAPNTKGSKA